MDGFYNPNIQDTMRSGYNNNFMRQYVNSYNTPSSSDYDWWNSMNNSFNTMGYMGREADWGSIPRAAAYGVMGPYGRVAGQMLGALAQRMQPGMPVTQGQMANMQQMIGSSPQQEMVYGFDDPIWRQNYNANYLRGFIEDNFPAYPRDVEKL